MTEVNVTFDYPVLDSLPSLVVIFNDGSDSFFEVSFSPDGTKEQSPVTSPLLDSSVEPVQIFVSLSFVFFLI